MDFCVARTLSPSSMPLRAEHRSLLTFRSTRVARHPLPSNPLRGKIHFSHIHCAVPFSQLFLPLLFYLKESPC